MWLRVRDIRALSHDQLTTLEFLKSHVRSDKPDSRYGFDPYASRRQCFPRKIFAASNDVVFASDGAPRSGFYADATDAIDQPIVEEAFRRLEAVWGTETWNGLAPFSRECLAHADTLYRDSRQGLARRDDVNPAPVLLQLARAVERELITEMLRPLLRAAGRPMDSDEGRELKEAMADVRPELTLGSIVHVIKAGALPQWAQRHLGNGPATQLLSSREWNVWLTQLVLHRNKTIHPTGRDHEVRAYVRTLATSLLEPDGGPPSRALEMICRAKQEILPRIAAKPPRAQRSFAP
jgi:hypothetical protein